MRIGDTTVGRRPTRYYFIALASPAALYLGALVAEPGTQIARIPFGAVMQAMCFSHAAIDLIPLDRVGLPESGLGTQGVASSRFCMTGCSGFAEDVQDTSPNERSFDTRADQTVVIGLGNEIACDDAVGILAARRLRRCLKWLPLVEVVELPWAGLRLLEAVRGVRSAILIDSLRSGKWAPGTVLRLSERDFAGSVRLNSFHDLSYPSALAFGRALGWTMPAEIDIYAVEGEVFDQFGIGLTPAVARGLEEVVEQVAGNIKARVASGHTAERLEAAYASGDET